MIKGLLVNTASNVSVLVVKLALTFILTPLIVRSLGKYDYGIWQLVVSFIGYMGVLDLGLRPAVSRFVAKFESTNDHEKLQVTYSSALLLLGSAGIIASLAFALWGLFGSTILSIDGEFSAKYRWLLLIIGAQLLFAFPGYAAESVLEGLQKFYVKNLVTIVNSLIGAAILWTVIDQDNGLIALAMINGIGGTVKYLIFTYLISRPDLGSLKISPSLAKKAMTKVLISFGGKSLIQGAASRVESNTDIIIIGAMLGPAAIITYSIPEALIRQLSMLTRSVTLAFMPLLSSVLAKGELERSKDIFLSSSKATVALVTFGAAGILTLGYPFIQIWIGMDIGDDAEAVIVILTLYLLLPLINPLDSRLLTALNQHGILAILHPAAAVANVLVSLVLAYKLGVIGIALGSLIPAIVIFPIVLNATCTAIGVRISYYLKMCVRSSVGPASIAFVAMLLLRWAWGVDTFLKIFIVATLGSSLFLISFWSFGLTKLEKTVIVEYTNAIIHRGDTGR